MKRTLWSAALALVAVTGATPALAQSAYTPAEGRGGLSLSYKADKYDTAWQGDEFNNYIIATKTKLMMLYAEYGIRDGWGLDLSGGYGELTGNSLRATPGPNKYGTLDTSIGLSRRMIDEVQSDKAWMPTVTLRLAAIIAGDYDWRPQALGDGASGGELGVFLGKSFGRYGVLGDVSYRKSEDPVPEALYGSVGTYAAFADGFVARLGYRFKNALSGYGHFRTLRGAPATAREEDYGVAELSLGYTDRGRRFYQISGSRTTDGFNTAKRTTVGASITMPF
jgi:hypothetical protein